MVIHIQIIKVPCKKNASALTGGFRLNDKCLLFILTQPVKLLSEILVLWRQIPSLRYEIVVIRESLLHSPKISCEQVFPTKNMHAREMIDSLVGFHPIKPITLYCSVGPKNIPIIFFRMSKLNLIDICYSPDYWIMTIAYIYHKSTMSVLAFLLLYFSLLFLLF